MEEEHISQSQRHIEALIEQEAAKLPPLLTPECSSCAHTPRGSPLRECTSKPAYGCSDDMLGIAAKEIRITRGSVRILKQKLIVTAGVRVSPNQIAELMSMFPDPERVAFLLGIEHARLHDSELNPTCVANINTLFDYRCRIRDFINNKSKRQRFDAAHAMHAAPCPEGGGVEGWPQSMNCGLPLAN